MDENSAPVVWVQFNGSRLEVDVAAKVLELLKERQPEVLGAYIGEAYTDTVPKPKSARGRG